jgi:hypothetical protein
MDMAGISSLGFGAAVAAVATPKEEPADHHLADGLQSREQERLSPSC